MAQTTSHHLHSPPRQKVYLLQVEDGSKHLHFGGPQSFDTQIGFSTMPNGPNGLPLYLKTTYCHRNIESKTRCITGDPNWKSKVAVGEDRVTGQKTLEPFNCSCEPQFHSTSFFVSR